MAGLGRAEERCAEAKAGGGSDDFCFEEAVADEGAGREGERRERAMHGGRKGGRVQGSFWVKEGRSERWKGVRQVRRPAATLRRRKATARQHAAVATDSRRPLAVAARVATVQRFGDDELVLVLVFDKRRRVGLDRVIVVLRLRARQHGRGGRGGRGGQRGPPRRDACEPEHDLLRKVLGYWDV